MKASLLSMRFYAVLGIVVVVLGLLVFGLYYFLFSWVVSESSDIQELKAEIATLEVRQIQAKVRRKDIDELSGDAARITAAFFDVKHPLPFFTSIEDAASTTGVQIVDMRLGESKKDPKSAREAEQEFVLNVAGSFQHIRNFIQLLELLPFEGRFSAARLEPAGDSGMVLVGSFRVALR